MLSQLLINPGAIATLCLYIIYICLMQKVCFCSLLIFRELICSVNKRTFHLYIINNLYKFFFFYMYHASFIILYYDQQIQLFHKLSHSYMFRHYHVILRELVISTLPNYISISYATLGNTIYKDVSHRFYASVRIIVIEISIL